jgi:hypothetical protein
MKWRVVRVPQRPRIIRHTPYINAKQIKTKNAHRFFSVSVLAETTGFEPATYGLTGRYANRYTTSPYKISLQGLHTSC